MFWPDPLRVIWHQIGATESSDIIPEQKNSYVYSHPTNSEIGVSVVTLVVTFIVQSGDPSVIWRASEADGKG